jgi:hypothetical protein
MDIPQGRLALPSAAPEDSMRRGTLIDDDDDISQRYITAAYMAIYLGSIYGGAEGHVD